MSNLLEYLQEHDLVTCQADVDRLRTLTIPDGVLPIISKSLTKWEEIAPNLELSEADIEAIDADNGSIEKKRHATLISWKNRLGSGATYYNLAEKFDNAGRRGLVDVLLHAFKLAETGSKLDEYTKQLDAKLAELCEKDKEWKESEQKLFELTGNWQSKREEWERNQKKRHEIMEAYEEIVKDQCEKLHSYTLGISRLLGSSANDQEMMKEIQRAVVMTAAADDDIQYGRESGNYLHGLTGHLGKLEDQEGYLKSFREELLERKRDIEQSLKELNELKAISDECNRDIEECGKALAKCDKGLEDCKVKIQKVKERLEEVEKERKKIVEEVGRCEVRLRSSTKDLENCQDRVKNCIDKLETRSEQLDGSIINAATGFGAIAGVVAGGITVAGLTGVGAATVILSGGTLAPVVVASAAGIAGAVGATGGGVAGGLTGRRKGTNIQRENENKRQKLRECRQDLEKCDDIIEGLRNIVNECRKEIDNMKDIIAKAHHRK